MSASQIVSTITGWPGRKIIHHVLYVINLMTFSMLALRDWFNKNRLFDSRSYSATVAQIIFTGVDALPTITFLGLATGFIFTFRLISISNTLGGTEDITNLLISVICLSAGPFLAAIIIISRTGSAIVVDLGNMKLHGEIEALENLGININDYLIAPRIISTAISQLAITVYFTVIALLSGILISTVLINPTYFNFIFKISNSFTPYLISIFVVKNIIFGFVIATVACYNGLRVQSSATEVPQRTTASIVQSLSFVFVIDALLTLAIFI
ncbi:MAG TPA: ABC transporter permease [Gammaproteobacteria bacterium]|nr:ABC transporter permease [Gammaproteobacteria bacterium]